MLRKFNININGKDYIVKLEEIEVEGVANPHLQAKPFSQQVAEKEQTPQPSKAVAPPQTQNINIEGTTIDSPMPGTILKVLVQVGDKVKTNQGLVVLEAMKMENEIVSPKDGTVLAVHVTEGSMIDVGKPMITIG